MQPELSTPIVTVEATAPQSESVTKQDWHAPTITRIDIKRTMFGGSFFEDGDGLGTTLT